MLRSYEPCMCGADDCPVCGSMKGTYCSRCKTSWDFCHCEDADDSDYEPSDVLPDDFDPKIHR